MKYIFLLLGLMCFIECSIISSDLLGKRGKHLFILSGQSNMVYLDPAISFTPRVQKEYGHQNIIVVKHAANGMAICNWYSTIGEKPIQEPSLYDILIGRIRQEIKKQKLETVSFIWMQGEQDAWEAKDSTYRDSLIGLYNQLSNDLKRKDINMIIGRLNDFDMMNESYVHWTFLRSEQIALANSCTRFDWVNTDDLNDGIRRGGEIVNNDIHMSAEGLEEMGLRFAERAIQIIEKHNETRK